MVGLTRAGGVIGRARASGSLAGGWSFEAIAQFDRELASSSGGISPKPKRSPLEPGNNSNIRFV